MPQKFRCIILRSFEQQMKWSKGWRCFVIHITWWVLSQQPLGDYGFKPVKFFEFPLVILFLFDIHEKDERMALKTKNGSIQLLIVQAINIFTIMLRCQCSPFLCMHARYWNVLFLCPSELAPNPLFSDVQCFNLLAAWFFLSTSHVSLCLLHHLRFFLHIPGQSVRCSTFETTQVYNVLFASCILGRGERGFYKVVW